MKKYIVTTTINPPTEAILKFCEKKDWNFIIVGDTKTPHGLYNDLQERFSNVIYMIPEEQELQYKELSDAIGWKKIQRRNIGYVEAYKRGADVVATVDDDNIPYEDWGENLIVGKEIDVNYYETDLPVFDPVGATNYPHIWHRGYPLQLLPKREYKNKKTKKIFVDIQADFWNGDPDIDAICRMEHSPNCDFDHKYFPITSNKISPFNSQNTFISRKVLKDYFLFPFIGRMDDIWASYYVQAKGFAVVYNKPTVTQARNEHNLINDMKAEYLGYENNLELVTDLYSDPDSIYRYIPDEAKEAFDRYRDCFTE